MDKTLIQFRENLGNISMLTKGILTVIVKIGFNISFPVPHVSRKNKPFFFQISVHIFLNVMTRVTYSTSIYKKITKF